MCRGLCVHADFACGIIQRAPGLTISFSLIFKIDLKKYFHSAICFLRSFSVNNASRYPSFFVIQDNPWHEA